MNANEGNYDIPDFRGDDLIFINSWFNQIDLLIKLQNDKLDKLIKDNQHIYDNRN